MMANPTRILTFLCVAVQQLAEALPVLRSALEVQVGQNISLVCNRTSNTMVTWYRLQSAQLLPLVTETRSKMGDAIVVPHGMDEGRFSITVDSESGSVRLEILQVQEHDAGLYFCSGRCEGVVCFTRGTRLTVGDVWEESDRNRRHQACLSLWICVLAVLVLIGFLGFFLCSGKPSGCRCRPGSGDPRSKVTEDAALHYSSLKYADKPRPPAQGAPRLAEEEVLDQVTYSAVTNRRALNGSHVQ